MVDDSILRSAVFHLIEDPCIGLFESGLEGDGRLPPNRAFDQRVVAAAVANSLRSIEVVVAFDPDPGDLLDEIHKPFMVTISELPMLSGWVMALSMSARVP